MSAPVSLEERERVHQAALESLCALAENYAEARAAGNLRRVGKLGREMDEAQQECRRADRRLRETRKRLGRQEAT